MNPHDPKMDPVGFKEFELGLKRAQLIKELEEMLDEQNWFHIVEVAQELTAIDSQIELIAELWEPDAKKFSEKT